MEWTVEKNGKLSRIMRGNETIVGWTADFMYEVFVKIAKAHNDELRKTP